MRNIGSGYFAIGITRETPPKLLAASVTERFDICVPDHGSAEAGEAGEAKQSKRLSHKAQIPETCEGSVEATPAPAGRSPIPIHCAVACLGI